MKKILSELNEAFVLLSTIPLAGDAVDTMAAAKTILRKAFGELKEMETGEKCPSSAPAGHLPPEGEGLGRNTAGHLPLKGKAREGAGENA